MSVTLAFTACTTSNGGLGPIENSAQNPNPQMSENDPSQSIEPDNNAAPNSTPSPDQRSNPASNVPVPMSPPLQHQQTAAAGQTAASSTQNSGTQQPSEQPLAEEKKPKKTALFSFGRKKEEPAAVVQSPATDEGSVPQQTLAMNEQTPATSPITQPSNAKAPSAKIDDSKATSSPNEGSSQPAETPQQAPQRDATSQKKGSLMRLFGRSDAQKQNKPVDSETKAALIPLPKKDPHEYNDVLPGVRPNGGIVIKHRTSLYDDTDIDANEIDSPSLYTLASVSIYGRSLPNGLKVARKEVEVSCLRPQLVAILKTIERRFNKPVIITSGYRSPAYNQKVNGAKRSMHMSCAAADIQVPDTNKWDVAKFVRALPNRGGVGTYCHQSIHVDVGPKRDWNWSCSAKN